MCTAEDRWSPAPQVHPQPACHSLDRCMISGSCELQPTLMARLALAYPKPPPDDEEQESSKEDAQETNGHVDPADVESGANSSDAAQ